MGTASTTKVLKQVAGVPTELAALTTSAGAGDAQALTALNASGVLDITFLNGVTTSAGAGSSGKTVVLNSAGQVDISMMPTGVGPDNVQIVASEAISAGALVNIWSNAGVVTVRNADGSTTGKEANGFVLAAVASAGTATVYFLETVTGLTGLTAGSTYYLSATTIGAITTTVTTGTGHTMQIVGKALSATSFRFQPQPPITLA